MKKLFLYIFLVLIFLIKPSIAKNLPHPLDFRGSEQEKKKSSLLLRKIFMKFIAKMKC